MLAAEGGDPEVVGWDGFADALQFENDLGIVMRGRFVDVQHEAIITKQSWSWPVSQFVVARRRSCGQQIPHRPFGPVRNDKCVPFWEEFVFWRGKFVDFEDLMD